MDGPRIGSLFSGYGGLDAAVEAVTGGRTVWHSEIDPGAAAILAHQYPQLPNLGDITTVDWDTVPPVDVLCGGFPCQDVSAAGLRRGLKPGTRSGLWAHFCTAIDRLHPRLVVIENVRGLLSAEAHHPGHVDLGLCVGCLDGQQERPLRALGAVLGDLADLGFDAEWQGIPASEAGAPHQRVRVFIIAWPAGDAALRGWDGARPAEGREGCARAAGGSGLTAADPGCLRSLPGRGHPGDAGHAAGGGACAEPVGRDQRPAADADGPAGDDPWRGGPGCAQGSVPEAGAGGTGRGGDAQAAAHADGDGCGRGEEQHGDPQPGVDVLPGGHADGRDVEVGGLDGEAAAHAEGDGRHEGRPEPAGQQRGPDAAFSGRAVAADPDGRESERRGVPGVVGGPPAAEPGEGDQRERAGHAAGDGRAVATDWGAYLTAVQRWEGLTRPAPAPTETGTKGQPRLSPRFVEWMMGLPDGWVTAVPGLTRNQMLKALGNGVVPQQAAHALNLLLSRTADLAV